jgi:hypothetical protein
MDDRRVKLSMLKLASTYAHPSTPPILYYHEHAYAPEIITKSIYHAQVNVMPEESKCWKW